MPRRLAGADAPLFSYLNAGKRSVTTVSDELLAGADIVIVTATGPRPPSTVSIRSACSAERRRCVVVTISDFGWTGPWSERPATEFTLQAGSGLTGFRGDPGGPPISIGGELGEYMGGAWAAYGALALRRRVRTRRPGGHLDMSMLEAITLMQSSEWLHSQLLQVPPVKRSVEVPSIEPAKDGYVGISMVTGQQWLDFAAMVDCPEFTEIPQSAVPDRAMGLPRLDPRTDRPVDARAHRRGDRRTRTAVPAAAGPARQRLDHPGHGSPARRAACTSTTRRDSGNRARRG